MLLLLGMTRPFASARAGISPADFAFVESVLATGKQAESLRRLCDDPDAVSHLLDLKEVHRALVENPLALPVSPSLYFYVLVRHAFLDGGIENPELADYVAGVLVEKLSSRPDPRPGAMPHWVTHAVDFVSVIRTAQGLLRFHLEIAAGDQFLVLTGLYPDYLTRRAERHGAPGLEFYESFARQAYRRAADNRDMPTAPRQIFGLLSEAFPIARRLLNRMADRCLF
jgi:hypothetical protein